MQGLRGPVLEKAAGWGPEHLGKGWSFTGPAPQQMEQEGKRCPEDVGGFITGVRRNSQLMASYFLIKGGFSMINQQDVIKRKKIFTKTRLKNYLFAGNLNKKWQ